MSILSKIFNKQTTDTQKAGGMEDFMMLIRVYFQASLAANLGIGNLAALPDLRVFKTSLHVPTQNNKLGIAEKAQCKKMLREIYHVEDSFFKEIDQSIRRNCHKMQDVQTYMLQFQGFSQDLMMLLGNLMKFKLRMPSIFKTAIRKMTENTVNEILNKNDFTDHEVMKTAVNIRKYNARLGFSEQWITNFVYQVVMLAKKEKPAAGTDK